MSSTFKNENPNFTASDKWRLTIGDLILLSRSVHDFSVPGVFSEGIDGPAPGSVMNPIPSERLTFDPVVFTFIIDEEWENWTQLYSWIVKNAESDDATYKDITIDILNNLNRPIGLQFRLEECRPTALDNVLLDVDGEVPQLVCTVTFKFLKMTPVRADKAISIQP
ncbi:hypothetical protein DEEACLCL_00007 [Salmonella phage CRW-SP2]|nr:hypothetical protein DEEACLCL_00007 [Salmonella phage CRW-SP2]